MLPLSDSQMAPRDWVKAEPACLGQVTETVGAKLEPRSSPLGTPFLWMASS